MLEFRALTNSEYRDRHMQTNPNLCRPSQEFRANICHIDVAAVPKKLLQKYGSQMKPRVDILLSDELIVRTITWPQLCKLNAKYITDESLIDWTEEKFRNVRPVNRVTQTHDVRFQGSQNCIELVDRIQYFNSLGESVRRLSFQQRSKHPDNLDLDMVVLQLCWDQMSVIPEYLRAHAVTKTSIGDRLNWKVRHTMIKDLLRRLYYVPAPCRLQIQHGKLFYFVISSTQRSQTKFLRKYCKFWIGQHRNVTKKFMYVDLFILLRTVRVNDSVTSCGVHIGYIEILDVRGWLKSPSKCCSVKTETSTSDELWRRVFKRFNKWLRYMIYTIYMTYIIGIIIDFTSIDFNIRPKDDIPSRSMRITEVVLGIFTSSSSNSSLEMLLCSSTNEFLACLLITDSNLASSTKERLLAGVILTIWQWKD
uniref:Uncharacterized protein n=1 Tax=Strigamia maritima TaxID=126957 RepID=T1IS96_STRMM